MSNDSVNDLADGQKLVSAQQDVARGVKNSETSDTNAHAKKRRDKGSTHVTRHGLLSKDIARALVRRGENLRSIRRHEKKFRDFFKVRGPLMELFFRPVVELHFAIATVREIGGESVNVESS